MQQRPITAESVKVDSTGLNLACRSNLIHSHADLKLSRKIWRRQFGVKPLDAVYDLCAKCQLLLRLRVGGGVEPNFAGETEGTSTCFWLSVCSPRRWHFILAAPLPLMFS